MNKFVPLGTRDVRVDRSSVLMTFNKVEVTSHYSILGVKVRERLSKESNLILPNTSFITRDGEKTDVEEEEGERGTGQAKENSEGVAGETRVERDRGDNILGTENVRDGGTHPRREGGGIAASVRGVVRVKESVVKEN